MSELRIELPPDVRAEVARRAGGDSAAESAWVADAVRERLAALAQAGVFGGPGCSGKPSGIRARSGQGSLG